MNLGSFLSIVEGSPTSAIRFHLPGGATVASHYHVTEVGRVTKDFVDCGGSRRSRTSCQLQLWVASDTEHSLKAGKLSTIFAAARHLSMDPSVPLEVQYGEERAVVYDVSCVKAGPEAVDVYLAGQKTECLAPDKCGVQSCCSGSRCC